MPIEFDCPYCDERLSLWDELAGTKGTCPKCKKDIVVPNPKGVYAMMSCPHCNGEVSASAVICTRCGTDLKHGTKLATHVGEPSALQEAAKEGAEQLLDILWRHRFIVGAVVIFFALIILLFSWLSGKSIHPARKMLDDDKPAAERAR